MSLLASLRLTPTAAMRRANPAPQSSGSLAGDADALRREVAGRSKDAISFASTLGQRDRKLALATALRDIDLQRQAADRLVDPAGRTAAYKQLLSRIEVALNVARKPGLLEQLPPEAATTAADKQPASTSAAKASPSAPTPAPAASVRSALDGDVAKRLEQARARLAMVDDPKRKAALAEALELAQKQSAAADRLTEPGARELALRQAMDRVQAAVLRAKDNDADAARVPQRRSTQELARDCRPAIVGAQADEQKRYREVSEAAESWKAKAAAKGPAQADAKKRQAALELELKGVQANLKQLDADLTAIDSPSATDATLHAVLARHQSAAVQRGQAGRGRTTVDSYGDPNDITGSKKTTTVTDYNKGIARTHETERSARLDDKGFAFSDGSTSTRSTGTTTVTRSRATTGTVDGDGLRVERSKKVETETDGLKEGREEKTGVKVDTKSATMSTTTTVNREDGSSSESTKSIGVERGDGKAGLAGSFGKAHQGEDESKKSHVVNVKGGVSAGKDGIGAYGQADLTLDKTTAKGFKGGLVPGLAPNIVCNVVPRDSTPQAYDVLLRVELGISVTAKGGYDKDPGKDSSGKARPDDSTRGTVEANVSVSHKVTMESKRHLTGPQLDAYLAALKTGDGTDKEFAVIKAGLTKGWDFARDVYLGVSGKATDVAEANKLAVGESTKVASETKGGAGVGLGTKGGGVGVGVEGGYERGSTTSTSVTKGADGKLIYDKQQGDSGKISYGGKVKAGAVEGGLSIGNLETTSTGYEIVIDPQDKRADKLQKELAACKSQADLDAFVARYGKAVVKSKTKGTAKADTLDVSAGIGDAAKGKLSFGHGVAESQTTDAEGNLLEKSVTGTSDGGAEFTVLGKKIGASSKAQLAATTDAQGHASADLSKTDTSPDMAKWLASNVPFSGGKDKTGSQGVLGKATGAAPDTDQTTVSGVKLSDSDLKNLGLLAAEDWKGWMDSCVSGDDRKEWATVGRRIQKAPEKQRGAVAATELARFVGASSRERNQIVASALGRRAGRVGAGTGYQFPGALAKWKDEYLQLVAPPVAALVARLLERKDPAAALDVGAPTLKRLDEMHRAFEMSADFESPALRAEMLGAIVARKTELRMSLRTAVAGPPTAKDELDDKKARYNDLLSNCINFQADEQKTFVKVDELVKDGGHHAIEITKLLNELKTVYAVWDKDYAQMSRLAEDNKFGSGNYWAYRPDMARFDKAHKFEAPGLASQVKKPSKGSGKAAPELTDEQLNEQASTNNDLINKGVKDAQAIERQLPRARARAMALSNKLEPLVADRKKAAAVKLYDQAYDLFTSAEKAAARIKPHDMKDLNSYGTQALQDYNAAAAGLTKALAMFTKA